MAAARNGQPNGVNGHRESLAPVRFVDIPSVIDIPVGGEGEFVDVDLTELLDDTDELCGLLENENAARGYWITIALAYVKQKKVHLAIDILKRGVDACKASAADDKLAMLACLCWLYLYKCRQAPRLKPNEPLKSGEDENLKDHWMHAATMTLNDASRLNPSYPPLYLARGVLCLLRAGIPSTRTTGAQEQGERMDSLKQAAKCFDDAHRTSGGKNVHAILGKARTFYSMGKFPEAFALYQEALQRRPAAIDPDPRIGIGCCLWQLGHKEPAKAAWQRSLNLNPDSKIANLLVGLYTLDKSNQFNANDPAFGATYRQAMTSYMQKAFKLDDKYALTCSAFVGYFLLRRDWKRVEGLARRAIERADTNATAGDGWYSLARKDHYEGNVKEAEESYRKADLARGGEERGYLPAKFAAAQIKILMGDVVGARFRLEKIISQSKNKSLEAMTLLGILHAEDVFASSAAGSKEDKSNEKKKAIALLEQVRNAWKDTRIKATKDSAVLLNLARLYEVEQPEKSLACLQQVEQMELDEIADEDKPEDIDDPVAMKSALRSLISPQLLNNMGTFNFQFERYSQARDDFQAALTASVKMKDRDDSIDTDSLVTTISYNLARTYEAESINDEAQKVYNGLLDRHPDYTDASTRLAFISLNSDPAKGAEALKQLMDSDPKNLEVRSLYGWWINSHKKRVRDLAEDQEQRHYKHTLQQYDKHDLYALMSMGNLHLSFAREIPRDTEPHKERRSKTYMRAVEFFDKVLTLDPKNAYAAQGMGIALLEEKKDTNSAIQIFSKIRESVKDASVHINLGHVFSDVKQFSRSIEHYDLALAKAKGPPNPLTLACLGHVWLKKGRHERSPDAYKKALEYAKQTVEAQPENVAFRFNVALVQSELARTMVALQDTQRTLSDLEAASQGLDEAIDSFFAIAKAPNPPFAKFDIEQRANMCKNTMKKQVGGAIEKQADYEHKNAARLEAARKQREEDIRRREEERQAAQAKAEEERRKIAEERKRMAEADREAARLREEEEKRKEEAEYTTDAETGERKKREKKPKGERRKRKKKGEDSDSDGVVDGTSDGEGEGKKKKKKRRSKSARASTEEPGSGSDAEAPRKKKKRRLERKGKAAPVSKYKSADMVVESDEEEGAGGADADAEPAAIQPDTGDESENGAVDDDLFGGEDETEDAAASSKRSTQRSKARVVDDEDEDEEMGDAAPADIEANGKGGEDDE
ncbi:hypothetical protein MBLNU230_g2159t1 [Neophaeotheca triangularis]